MSRVRLLIGTRKGAFILTSDAARTLLANLRTPLPRLGALPPQSLPRRPQPHLRLPNLRLVRPASPALRRRRPHLLPVGNQFTYDGRPRHPPVVRRHAPPLGVQARLAPRALAHRPRHLSSPESKTPASSSPPTAATPGTSSPASATPSPAPTGSPAPAASASTPSSSTPPTPTASSSPSPPPEPSAPTTPAKPGSPSTRASTANTSPTPPPRSATASTTSP